LLIGLHEPSAGTAYGFLAQLESVYKVTVPEQSAVTEQPQSGHDTDADVPTSLLTL
jgi:hypothetical protein